MFQTPLGRTVLNGFLEGLRRRINKRIKAFLMWERMGKKDMVILFEAPGIVIFLRQDLGTESVLQYRELISM